MPPKTLSDTIAGKLGLVEERVTTPVKLGDHNGSSAAENGLESMPSGLVNKTNNKKLKLVSFNNRFSRTIKEVYTSTRHLTMLTEGIFDNQELIPRWLIFLKRNGVGR